VKRGAKFLGAFVFLLVAPLVLYFAYNAWDRHRLSAFCDDMRPGTSIESIEGAAAQHGIDPKWVNAAALDGPNGTIVVLASSEMGEMTCDLQIRDGVVSTSKVYGP
jgi:hypothetical protein